MILVLNGYPGVGKLTIGRKLAADLGGRLLDIHTVYNVAFALSEFGTDDFWNTIDQIALIADGLIHKLPPREPVILTTVLTEKSDRERTEWRRMVSLGTARPPFCVVHIGCDLDENIRRIQSEDRTHKRKPRDPDMAIRNQTRALPLAGLEQPFLLKLDTTALTPAESAETIAAWARVCQAQTTR